MAKRFSAIPPGELISCLQPDGELSQELEAILSGKIKSWRHDVFYNGPPKRRGNLRYCCFLSDNITSAQYTAVLDHLTGLYCKQDMKLFSYVADVLVTEAIIRLIAKYCGLELDEAEKFLNYKEVASSEQPSHHQILQQPASIKDFTHMELKTVTRDFSKLIGAGGFGAVYEGTDNGFPVVVKVLHKNSQCDLITAMNNLTGFCHPNILCIIGYCKEVPAVVYPLMVKLSLFHCIHEVGSVHVMNWNQRLKIIIGVAKGLCYLHPSFLHLNIKSSNILLDETYTAKITDLGFGLPTLKQIGSTSTLSFAGSHDLVRSRGYVAPEFKDGIIGPATDVYSYGITALEIFTGLLVYVPSRAEEKLLDHCVELKLWQDVCSFQSLSDKRANTPSTNLCTCFMTITKSCTMTQYKKRCSMNEVMQMWSEQLPDLIASDFTSVAQD